MNIGPVTRFFEYDQHSFRNGTSRLLTGNVPTPGDMIFFRGNDNSWLEIVYSPSSPKFPEWNTDELMKGVLAINTIHIVIGVRPTNMRKENTYRNEFKWVHYLFASDDGYGHPVFKEVVL